MAMQGHPLGTFRITVDPSPAKIAKTLRVSSKRFSNWKPAWLQLAPFLVEMMQSTIDGGGSADARWAQLAISTIATKQRKGRGTAPLIGTRALYDRVGSYRKITGRRLKVGPSDRYVFVQMAGTTSAGPRRNVAIPGRSFTAWTAASRQIAINILSAHAKEMIGEIAEDISRG